MYYEKIWVHRTNSIEKLNEVRNDFSGVELDVEYLDSVNVFDVNHPPAKSIGLNLNTYLEVSKGNKKLHYWLDFKNLNPQNQEKSLSRLLAICSTLELKPSNFIVESGEMDLLQHFQKQGFNVSYYLNWPGLYTLNENQLNVELDKIKKSLNNNSFPCYISSDYRDYEILKTYFVDRDLLLWLDDQFVKDNSIGNKIKLMKMLSDDRVKVVLFKHHSRLIER